MATPWRAGVKSSVVLVDTTGEGESSHVRMHTHTHTPENTSGESMREIEGIGKW